MGQVPGDEPSRPSVSRGACTSHLEDSGKGAILNVVSAGAFLFSANTAMYAAAKAGLMSMTRSMAAVFALKGIRVNTLAPGTVDTDMVRNNPPETIESMKNACFRSVPRIPTKWSVRRCSSVRMQAAT